MTQDDHRPHRADNDMLKAFKLWGMYLTLDHHIAQAKANISFCSAYHDISCPNRHHARHHDGDDADDGHLVPLLDDGSIDGDHMQDEQADPGIRR